LTTSSAISPAALESFFWLMSLALMPHMQKLVSALLLLFSGVEWLFLGATKEHGQQGFQHGSSSD